MSALLQKKPINKQYKHHSGNRNVNKSTEDASIGD